MFERESTVVNFGFKPYSRLCKNYFKIPNFQDFSILFNNKRCVFVGKNFITFVIQFNFSVRSTKNIIIFPQN